MYYNELDDMAKHHYREKLDKIGLVDDPYVMHEQGINSGIGLELSTLTFTITLFRLPVSTLVRALRLIKV
jgi:hypothetical protein